MLLNFFNLRMRLRKNGSFIHREKWILGSCLWEWAMRYHVDRWLRNVQEMFYEICGEWITGNMTCCCCGDRWSGRGWLNLSAAIRQVEEGMVLRCHRSVPPLCKTYSFVMSFCVTLDMCSGCPPNTYDIINSVFDYSLTFTSPKSMN